MTLRKAAFAIPGDITTLTGGYIYERRLLRELRALGHDVQHLELPAAFPDPSRAEMGKAIEQLTNLEPDRALILDGLIFGAVQGLEAVSAPIVAMVHHPLAFETGLTRDRREYLFETERSNAKLVRHVLVPSRHTAHILETQYDLDPAKITITPPGTDQPAIGRTPQSPPLILSVGLQHPRKGHDILLQALADVIDLEWQAMIVGRTHDAEHSHKLAVLVNDLGLSDRAKLAGAITRVELEQLYNRATLFALATRYEGYGIVFDEALSWGLPIISCNTGAVPDTVPKDAGLLTAVDDPAAMSNALRHVLEDDNLRAMLSAASAAAGRQLPSWRNTAEIASGVLETLR